MQKNKQQDQSVREAFNENSVETMEMRSSGNRQELLQSLSAMMDDEAESLELRRVVKAAAGDRELTATWGRYHAVRASLRQELQAHQRPGVDLLSGIKDKLAAEPAVGGKLINNRSFAGRMLKLAGQGAIAATVAAAVIVGSSLRTGSTDQSPAAQVADTDATQALPALNGDFSASPLTRTVSMDAAARDRLEQAVRNYTGTTAVLNTATSPMFRTQLEPFAAPATPATSAANSGTRQNGQ